jgi:transcriptional regulator with XRE-family HTH domain
MEPAPDTVAARRAIFEAIDRNELDLRVALKRLRRAMGLSQARYAKLIGINVRVLIDFERGVGNPTLASLEAMGKPFGLAIGFVRQRR